MFLANAPITGIETYAKPEVEGIRKDKPKYKTKAPMTNKTGRVLVISLPLYQG